MSINDGNRIRVQTLRKRERKNWSRTGNNPLPMTDARACDFAPAAILYQEGQDANGVYLINHGLVKLVCYLPNGQARITRLHASGSLVCLSSLFDARYEHTAIAVGRVQAEYIPVCSLLQLRVDEPAIYCSLLESWIDELHDADTWITQFSTGSIRARVARLVNYLSGIGPRKSPTEVQLLTCEEMAAVLGVTPESVSRVLAEFKRGHVLRGIACKSIHRFERDIEALHRVAQD